MKKYLLTGLITLLPIAFTILLIIWVFNLLTEPFAGMLEQMIVSYENFFGIDIYKHEQLALFASRIIVLLLLFFSLLLLGFIANKFFFKSLINFFNSILLRIPIIRTIYSISKEVTHGFIKPNQKLFEKSTLVPFPYPETRAIGLVSSPIPDYIQKKLPEDSISVFVPTSPHLISGFIIFFPKNLTTDIPFTTEEVCKFLISCGTVFPNEIPPEK